MKFAIALAIASIGLSCSSLAAADPSPPAAPTHILDKTQEGFYRLKIGNADVIALSDGTLAFPADDLLLNAKPGEIHQLLDRAFDPSPLASVNSFLILLPGRVMLIDTGAETLLGPTLGKLPGSLKAAGMTPESVTDVFLTHIHPDHAGGLMIGSHKEFPNAVIHVEQLELNYWLDKSHASATSDLIRPFFDQAQQKVGPYLRDGQVKPFRGPTEFFPGFSAVPSHGHTPGHTTYILDIDGHKLVFVGDTAHVTNIQFADPGIAVKFDSDPIQAVAQRRKALNDAAAGGYLLAFTHVSYPGIGHVRKAGDHFEWIPVTFVDDAILP
jgi:glyoxylase-like metal-dependent hydrolase (beta-lactamase superfamily II)